MKKAFTLIELVVVAVIVGLLALVAIPNMIVAVNRGYAKDARNNLMGIYAAQQNYFQNHGQYLDCSSAPTLSDCINHSDGATPGLGLNIVANNNTTYGCNPAQCWATQGTSFTMIVNLPEPIGFSTQGAEYCNGNNLCCLTGGVHTPGAPCP